MDEYKAAARLQGQLETIRRSLVSGRRVDAITGLRSLLKKNLPGAAWSVVAQMLMRAGDIDSALEAARKFASGTPGNVEADSLLANLLADTGQLDASLKIARRVAKQLPGNADVHYNLGIYLSRAGQTMQARDSFREAVSLDPDHAFSIEYLASLDDGGASSDLLDLVEACLSRGNIENNAAKAALQYARAALLDRMEEYEQAFDAYEAGAELMKSVVQTDMDEVEGFVARLKKVFGSDFYDSHAKSSFGNTRPIFIVGMPRSGTTLVESVFASHSNVSAGGETGLLSLATMQHGSFGPRAITGIDSIISAGKKPWNDMGRELRRLHNVRYGTKKRLTEKNLGHHFHLGVIAMIAAGARIIYCTRDTTATAWSCFRNRFSNGNGWSYDFESIRRYQRLYGDLMEHWQAVLPDAPILEVSYEDFVNSPADLIPEMLAHSGLEMEQACLEPHLSKMPVATASVIQVRQPIHTDANSAWQRYRPQLERYFQT